MGDMKGRQVRKRTSSREAGVKPWGPVAKADLPIAGRVYKSFTKEVRRMYIDHQLFHGSGGSRNFLDPFITHGKWGCNPW